MAKTNRPMIRIHNSETNEIFDREMNDEEFAQYEIDQQKRQAKMADEMTKKIQRAALLERLGISQDEAELLLS
jgi:hypothetical protein